MSARVKLGSAGGAVLLAVWLWPLPWLDLPPFTAHMLAHVAVVAIAAPLLALAIAGTRLDPAVHAAAWVAAIPASIVELFAVWAWHAPRLHDAAREWPWVHALEQATFLVTGLALWIAALGGTEARRRERATEGVIALLLTSMHMTLLGALIALTPRVLYLCAHGDCALAPLADQQLGGALMIVLGSAAYLAGGVALTAHVLSARPAEEGA